MNKIKLIPLACAALMMSACSSDDPSNGGSTGVNEPQYLSVNIVNVGATPTGRGTDTDSDYEGGTKEENEISKVRFYFFNGDGSPYLIKDPGVAGDGVTTGDKEVNWLEATPGEDKTTSGTPSHVEKITNAVLVINGVQSAAPSSIVAVVNPGTLAQTTLNSGGQMRLSELREKAVGSQFYKTGTGKGTEFVMSNSVFVNAGTDVCASLVAGHVTTSAEAAKANPVDLYVERVAAKVTADFDPTAFKTGDGTDWNATQYGTTKAVGKIGDYDVYAVIDGWGLADENGKAEIEKQVSTSWTDGIIGITPWTTYDYHRCFWENSVSFGSGAGANRPVNHKFNDFKAKKNDVLYTLPNTPLAKITNVYDNDVTKFLVAATLKYQDNSHNWHTAEICRYNGVQFLGVDNLKTQVALTFSKYYTSTNSDAENPTYTQLTKDDITFADPTGSMKSYQVNPTLVNDPAKKYFTKSSTGNYTEVPKGDVNTAIGADKAEIRTDGKAYYFVPIRHLGTDETAVGYYGVVRNHFYKINLTGIKGFGTPVYDPKKEIDPTVPSYSNTYLAARVQVLQWRIVNQNVSLGE